MKQTEIVLIQKACSGDNQAFAEFVHQHISFVYALALRYMRSAEDADDVTQLVFVKVWRNLGRFDARKSSCKSWIGEITKNTCLDELKKKRATPFSAFDMVEGDNFLEEVVASDAPTAGDEFDQKVRAKEVRQAMEKLAVSLKSVLALYYEKGLNFREIGEQLNEPMDTIKSRHRRALVQLKKLMVNQ